MAVVTRIPRAQHPEWHAAISQLCDSFGIVGDAREELAHWFDRPRDEAPRAHLDRALDLLAQLVVLVPATAFAWPAAQDSLRGAQALLAELGRGKPDALRERAAMWIDAPERKR